MAIAEAAGEQIIRRRVPFRSAGVPARSAGHHRHRDRRCCWSSSRCSGPFIAPYPGAHDTGQIDVPTPTCHPAWTHLFGTDDLGRDVYSRVILGARPAFVVSILVVGFAILIGVPLGAIAGYRRGRIDGLIMRTTDLFLAFPPLLLAMAIVAALGPGLEHAAIALIISWWPWYARIARAVTVSLREQPFVDAARAIGVRDLTIIRRHIVPNSLSPIVVQATVDVGTVILAAGSLAFIGLGARPPTPGLGPHGRGRPGGHPRPVVGVDLPRPRHLRHGAGLQPRR